MKTKLIQLLLAGFAFISFVACWEIGNEYNLGQSRYPGANFKLRGGSQKSVLSTPITSGFNGGALGMGIICASSLIGIVLLETKKN